MFDIGWSELVLIGVVALIAIGPKELPGVLRMVGQWMGKARKMAAEFQGQFQEAMREAEMADLKKSFDEVKEAASGFAGNNLMTSLQKDVSDALRVDALDKPAETSTSTAVEPPSTSSETPATSSEALATSSEAPATPTTPEAPTPETFVEAEAHAAVNEPLAITREVEQVQVTQGSVTQGSVTQDSVIQDTAPAEAIKDAKAS
ncbi:sec-independent protein translocase protein TatB [Bradyrhizobium sp. F1.13.1]